jgi:hypothetical protein
MTARGKWNLMMYPTQGESKRLEFGDQPQQTDSVMEERSTTLINSTWFPPPSLKFSKTNIISSIWREEYV